MQQAFYPEKAYEEANKLGGLIRLMTVECNYQPNKTVTDIAGKIRQNWEVVSAEAIDYKQGRTVFSAACFFLDWSYLRH